MTCALIIKHSEKCFEPPKKPIRGKPKTGDRVFFILSFSETRTKMAGEISKTPKVNARVRVGANHFFIVPVDRLSREEWD